MKWFTKWLKMLYTLYMMPDGDTMVLSDYADDSLSPCLITKCFSGQCFTCQEYRDDLSIPCPHCGEVD